MAGPGISPGGLSLGPERRVWGGTEQGPPHPGLDVLGPAGIGQGVPGLLEGAARWADVGNHHGAAVSPQGVLDGRGWAAVSRWRLPGPCSCSRCLSHTCWCRGPSPPPPPSPHFFPLPVSSPKVTSENFQCLSQGLPALPLPLFTHEDEQRPPPGWLGPEQQEL